MKALIIYDSTFGNTEHIAQAIAQKLREHGSVQLVTVEVHWSIKSRREAEVFRGPL